MKQEEDKFTGLPENAFRELKPGEVYNPLMSPSKNYPEVNFWSVAWGIAMAILFSAAAAYLGLEGRASIRSCYSDCDYRGRCIRSSQEEKCVGRKCNHPVYRSLLGSDCGGSYLHLARSLYPSGQISRNDGYFHAGVHQFSAGWRIGYPVPDSFPEIFRQ